MYCEDKVLIKFCMTLHCGYAIEGAIGTESKIDANYLSDNVHIVNELHQVIDHY